MALPPQRRIAGAAVEEVERRPTLKPMQTSIVDVDDRTTWPDDVAALSGSLAKTHRGSTKYCVDLRLGDDVEKRFRRLLGAVSLRAYHCTRLLPHEVESIRAGGLRMLTSTLIADRIDHALVAGAITEEEAADWKGRNVFAENCADNRENRVCLSLSKNIFRELAGVESLLSMWGGEGIYMSEGGSEIRPRLERLGNPAIVVARVSVDASSFMPDISKVFVGAALGLEDLGADVFHHASIAAEGIEAIITPADARYRAYGALPLS